MKPILFNTSMVRAILDGSKTVTRRVVKPQPEGAHYVELNEEDGMFDFICGAFANGMCIDYVQAVKPPYKTGDILYVRETGAELETVHGVPYYAYKADDKMLNHSAGENFTRWRPSIHMQKEAARIFLRVTNVRVERLQDITPEQIDAEGCKEYAYSAETGELQPSKPTWFKILWDSTIKKADMPLYGWDANPWVWVISFERISREEAV